jgi:hypothetical protein
MVGDYIKFSAWGSTDPTYNTYTVYYVLSATATTFTLATAADKTTLIASALNKVFDEIGTTIITKINVIKASDGIITVMSHGLVTEKYIKFTMWDSSYDTTYDTNTLYFVTVVDTNTITLSTATDTGTVIKPINDDIIDIGTSMIIQRHVIDTDGIITTQTDHGFVVGDYVKFTAGPGDAIYDSSTLYYVKSTTSTTFSLATAADTGTVVRPFAAFDNEAVSIVRRYVIGTDGIFTTPTAHGLVAGDYVKFSVMGTFATTYDINTLYYVQSATTDTFTLATATDPTTLVMPTTVFDDIAATRIHKTYVIKASDGYITVSGHGFNTGNYIKFTEWGSVDATYDTNTIYYVTVMDTNTITLSTDANTGTVIKPINDIVDVGTSSIQRYHHRR